jgi:hypothetical protein
VVVLPIRGLCLGSSASHSHQVGYMYLARAGTDFTVMKEFHRCVVLPTIENARQRLEGYLPARCGLPQYRATVSSDGAIEGLAYVSAADVQARYQSQGIDTAKLPAGASVIVQAVRALRCGPSPVESCAWHSSSHS